MFGLQGAAPPRPPVELFLRSRPHTAGTGQARPGHRLPSGTAGFESSADFGSTAHRRQAGAQPDSVQVGGLTKEKAPSSQFGNKTQDPLSPGYKNNFFSV